MRKFEIKLTDDEIDRVWGCILRYEFPKLACKNIIAITEFGSMSAWNIRKVREAVSRLQELGKPIIAHHGGYSVFGDDPQPVIEYLNREYHRVYEATKKNDQVFAALKRKYGDEVSAKVKVNPDQPALPVTASVVCNQSFSVTITPPVTMENKKAIPFQKTYDRDGTLHNV